MQADAIARARALGFTFVCSTCELLQEALARGEKNCVSSLMGRVCGGPLSLNTFPEYRGPIQDMTAHCVFSGAEPVAAVEVQGKLFGLSEEGVRVMESFSRRGEASYRVRRVEVPLVKR